MAKRLTPEERAKLSKQAQELSQKGKTAAEIAKEMGITPVAVGMYLSYARRASKPKRGRPSAGAKSSTMTRISAPVAAQAKPSAAPTGKSDDATLHLELLQAENQYLRAKLRLLERGGKA